MTLTPPLSSSSRRRRLSVAAAFVAIVAAVGAAVVVLGPALQTRLPAQARVLSQQCKTIQGATASLSWRRPGAEDMGVMYTIHLRSGGMIGLELVRSSVGGVGWGGCVPGVVRIDRPTIYHIDVYDEMIQDFWSECRSGFANSTWTVVPRPEGERAGPTDWVRLYLPFEWAEEVEINIGTVQSDLSLLALRHRATGQRLSIAVTEHTWIATVPNMAPDSDPLPFSPPAPEEWTAIGSTPPDETERYVESLTGPNGFELLQLPQ